MCNVILLNPDDLAVVKSSTKRRLQRKTAFTWLIHHRKLTLIGRHVHIFIACVYKYIWCKYCATVTSCTYLGSLVQFCTTTHTLVVNDAVVFTFTILMRIFSWYTCNCRSIRSVSQVPRRFIELVYHCWNTNTLFSSKDRHTYKCCHTQTHRTSTKTQQTQV